MKCPQLSKPKANGHKGEKGNSGKEPKLHLGRMEKKSLGEPRFSRGANSPLANEQTVYDYDSGSIIGQKSY